MNTDFNTLLNWASPRRSARNGPGGWRGRVAEENGLGSNLFGPEDDAGRPRPEEGVERLIPKDDDAGRDDGDAKRADPGSPHVRDCRVWLRTRDLDADPAAPRRERVERAEPVHRLGRRRPHRQGRREAVRAGRTDRPSWTGCPDVLYTSLLRRAITTANLARQGRSALDSGASRLAAQRASPRCAVGAGQGGDQGPSNGDDQFMKRR